MLGAGDGAAAEAAAGRLVISEYFNYDRFGEMVREALAMSVRKRDANR